MQSSGRSDPLDGLEQATRAGAVRGAMPSHRASTGTHPMAGSTPSKGSELSGKKAALRLLSPLRTGHASFPAHGSSLYEGQLPDPDALLIVVCTTVMLTNPPIEPADAPVPKCSEFEVIRKSRIIWGGGSPDLDVAGDFEARGLEQVQVRDSTRPVMG